MLTYVSTHNVLAMELFMRRTQMLQMHPMQMPLNRFFFGKSFTAFRTHERFFIHLYRRCIVARCMFRLASHILIKFFSVEAKNKTSIPKKTSACYEHMWVFTYSNNKSQSHQRIAKKDATATQPNIVINSY